MSGALGLLPLTVPEIRRLLVALVWTIPVQPAFVLAGHGGAAATRPALGVPTISGANGTGAPGHQTPELSSGVPL